MAPKPPPPSTQNTPQSKSNNSWDASAAMGQEGLPENPSSETTQHTTTGASRIYHLAETAASLTQQQPQMRHPNTDSQGRATGRQGSVEATPWASNRRDVNGQHTASIAYDRLSLSSLTAPGVSTQTSMLMDASWLAGGSSAASGYRNINPETAEYVARPAQYSQQSSSRTAAPLDARGATIQQLEQFQQQLLVQEGQGTTATPIASTLDYSGAAIRPAAGGGRSLISHIIQEQLPPPPPIQLVAAANSDPEAQRLLLDYVTRENQILYQLLLASSTSSHAARAVPQQQRQPSYDQQPQYQQLPVLQQLVSSASSSSAEFPGVRLATTSHRQTAPEHAAPMAGAAGMLRPSWGFSRSSSNISGISDPIASNTHRGAQRHHQQQPLETTSVASTPSASAAAVQTSNTVKQHFVTSSSSSPSPHESIHQGGSSQPKRKQELALNRPKRPLSAYNIFVKEERARIVAELEEQKQQHHDASSQQPPPLAKQGFETVGREIGRRWKQLDPDQKRVYQERAAIDKKRHEQELAVYQAAKHDELEAKRQRQEATVTDAVRKRYLATGGATRKRNNNKKKNV